MHLAARYEVTDAKQVRTAPVSVLTSPRLGYDCVFISSIGMQVAGGGSGWVNFEYSLTVYG